MQISPRGSGELKTSKSDFPYWESGWKEQIKKGIHNYVNVMGVALTQHEMLEKIAGSHVQPVCPGNIQSQVSQVCLGL